MNFMEPDEFNDRIVNTTEVIKNLMENAVSDLPPQQQWLLACRILNYLISSIYKPIFTEINFVASKKEGKECSV